jgi:hypothetical protein
LLQTPAARRRPVPALSLLMHGVAVRLLGAAGMAALLWLAVAWAMQGPA